ncbi:MAG: methionyl-tRNA formyltransferase [Candidatus Paceibacterota bacterium]|jgi:methionyl-tRNA formyltransferase
MDNQIKINFAFFGSSQFSVITLDEFYRRGLIPSYIVTTQDKPQGRKMIMTPNVVKQWANEKSIKVYDPAKLDPSFIAELNALQSASEKSENTKSANSKCDVFIVASYGKIIPESVLNIPPRKTLNIHPSLLPKYRGPSPLPTTILDDTKHTGVTIMRLDKEMDHGPIIAQKDVTINEWPTYEKFEEKMAIIGASLLAEILSKWINGEISEKEQDHAIATYTKKITKEDGLLDLNGDAYTNFRKIQAFHEWPQAYFFIEHKEKKIRVKITEAVFTNNELKISRVIPEGGKEISYEDFLRGY